MFENSVVENDSDFAAESRVIALGKTNAGRYLTVVYTKRGNRIRVVTAFPTKRKHRRAYDEQAESGEG